jgi:hypothetical protein
VTPGLFDLSGKVAVVAEARAGSGGRLRWNSPTPEPMSSSWAGAQISSPTWQRTSSREAGGRFA